MEQEEQRGSVVDCTGCVYFSQHAEDMKFCLALCVFLKDCACARKQYRAADPTIDRVQDLIKAME